MTLKYITYRKGNLSKLLVAIALFVSVFAFSGDFGNAAPSKTEAFQTELFYSLKPVAPKTITYSKILVFFFVNNYAIHLFYDHGKYILLWHERLFQTRWRALVTRVFSYFDQHFLPIKIIPASSDEAPSPALRG